MHGSMAHACAHPQLILSFCFFSWFVPSSRRRRVTSHVAWQLLEPVLLEPVLLVLPVLLELVLALGAPNRRRPAPPVHPS